MKLSQITKRKWFYPAIAFFIPVITMLMVMIVSGYVPFGNYSMLYSDMFHQYYPFFVSFRRALLTGQSLFYNWDVGMGMEFVGLASYYLTSPLNLLSVLVPENWVLSYFSLLVPLKLGFASLFFALMLRKLFDKNDFSLCVFGAFYGLCAWALGYQWNVMWLDTFAMLPLVMLGAVRLLRDKKCVLYTVTLCLSICFNYYVGLFTCIFVFLFFCCYEVCRCRSGKRFLSDLVRIAVFSVLAIGMSAFLELPTLAALQNTHSSVNQFPKGFKMNIADKNTWLGLLSAMRQVVGNVSGGLEPTFKEGLPNLYCGVGMVLLSTLFLTSKRIALREKICSILLLLFLILSFILRQLDYIWHGFHFTNMIPYRFSFIFSFVVLYMAYRAWLIRDTFKPWQLIVSGAVGAYVFFCCDDRSDPVFIAYNFGFLLIYLLPMACGLGSTMDRQKAAEDNDPEVDSPAARALAQKRSRSICSGMLAGIAMLEIILNVVNFGVRFPGTAISNYPRGTEASASIIRYMKEREEGNPFYRAEVTYSQTLNDGALNGYYGITTFTSSANVNVTQFMKKLGYASKNTYNRYLFENGSPVGNLFLGLKYMIERHNTPAANRYFDQVHYNDKIYLLENNAYLPLGFLTNGEFAQLDFSNNLSCIAFQNKMFREATGIDDPVWSFIPSKNIKITGKDVKVGEQSTLGCINYSEGKKGAVIEYDYTVHKDGFLCINLDLSGRNNYTVKKNGKTVFSESITLPQFIAVSDVVAGDNITVEIKCKDEKSGKTILLAAVMDDAVFREGYQKLAASTLDITSFENTRVEGTIHCNRDGFLYTSIPQDGNWSATVDGKPAQITLIGDAMIGVNLTQGDHTVVFSYHNKAFTTGLLISLMCTAAFVMLVAIGSKNIKKRTKK